MEFPAANVERLYRTILDCGANGTECYYQELRKIGIKPTPKEKKGSLFAPNPVILPRSLINTIIADLNRFCAARLSAMHDASELQATMPSTIRPIFGQREIADVILDNMKKVPPFACLDCFLVESQDGFVPAYLEWQTFPAYHATAVYCLEAMEKAFPGIAEAGGHFSPIEGETMAAHRQRVQRSMLEGIENDPRQGVIIDFEPNKQETAFDFDLQVAMSGGQGKGIGVIDPRQVVYQKGQPYYRREGQWIPIRSVFSRLVHGDIETRLLPALGSDEKETLTRFFNETEAVTWRVHPLHFLYGTKGDLPTFRRLGLSPFIPSCETITATTIDELRCSGTTRLDTRVQKPVEGHGGRDVIDAPRIDQLEIGALLQDRIMPVAHHQTLHGNMTPEIRVMAMPSGSGDLVCSSVFTRVKAPQEFRSNAGAIANRAIPGTGEGYAIIVD